MPESLILRGAVIRFADTRTTEGGVFSRLHLTADFSSVVAEAMGWNTGTNRQGKLIPSELPATYLTLMPDPPELQRHALQFEITGVDDFQFFEVQGEDGESKHIELRFTVRTPVDGAAAAIENYMRRAGASAQLRLDYTKQTGLNLEAAGSDETPTAEGSQGGPTLAPVAVMGGSHQKKGRGRAAKKNQAAAEPEPEESENEE